MLKTKPKFMRRAAKTMLWTAAAPVQMDDDVEEDASETWLGRPLATAEKKIELDTFKYRTSTFCRQLLYHPLLSFYVELRGRAAQRTGWFLPRNYDSPRKVLWLVCRI